MLPVYVATAGAGDGGIEVLAAYHTEGEARRFFHEHRKAHPYDRGDLVVTAWDGGLCEVLLQACGVVTLGGRGRACDQVRGHVGPHVDTAHAEYLARRHGLTGTL